MLDQNENLKKRSFSFLYNSYLLLATFCFYSFSTVGQNYVVKTSTRLYRELDEKKSTIVNIDSKSQFGRAYIPFKIKSFGKEASFDSALIFSSFACGLIGPDSSMAFCPFYLSSVITRAEGSSVSYVMTGKAPRRTLKIQWKNLKFNQHDSTDYVNFQLWLNETDNTISMHIGPNQVTSRKGLQIQIDNAQVIVNGPQIGIYYTDLNGIWSIKNELINNPSNPDILTVRPDNGLNGIPKPNTFYSFTQQL